MADRQMIIKSLEWWCKNQKGEVLPLAYSAVVETLEALKEQEDQIDTQRDNLMILLNEPRIVKCKNCKKMETMYCPFYWRYKGTKYDDWFCADGERRDG